MSIKASLIPSDRTRSLNICIFNRCSKNVSIIMRKVFDALDNGFSVPMMWGNGHVSFTMRRTFGSCRLFLHIDYYVITPFENCYLDDLG